MRLTILVAFVGSTAIAAAAVAPLAPPTSPPIVTLQGYENWACADRHPRTLRLAANTCYALANVDGLSVYQHNPALEYDARKQKHFLFAVCVSLSKFFLAAIQHT
jgi:hypothetical protein